MESDVDEQVKVPFASLRICPVFEPEPEAWIAAAYYMHDGKEMLALGTGATEYGAIIDLGSVFREEGIAARLEECTDPLLRRRLTWSARWRVYWKTGVPVRELPSDRENGYVQA
jgi:hypothetical protein